MTIDKISFGLNSLKPIQQPERIEQPKVHESNKKGSFGEIFQGALKEVNTLQNEADNKIQEMIVNKGSVSTHEVMVAIEKADVAFQLMNQVRAKIVRAYEEVLRTAV